MSHTGDILVYVSFNVKDNEHIVFLGDLRTRAVDGGSNIVYTNVFHFPIIPFMYSDLKVVLPIYEKTIVDFAEITYMAIDGPLRKKFSDHSFIFRSYKCDYLIKWHHIEKLKKTPHTESVVINGHVLQTLENEVSEDLFADYCISM